jgi:zinc transporter ZupT
LNWSRNKTAAVLITFAFLAMGMLIGTLLAFSAQSLSKSVIAAMFAFFGGSLLAFLQKLSIIDQIKASGGLGAIALGTILGVYSGLYVNEHQLLTPQEQRVSNSNRVMSKESQVPASGVSSGKDAAPHEVVSTTVKDESSEAARTTRPRSTATRSKTEPLAPPEKYLRANVISKVDAIDQQYRNGLPAKEAYEQLLEAIRANTK